MRANAAIGVDSEHSRQTKEMVVGLQVLICHFTLLLKESSYLSSKSWKEEEFHDQCDHAAAIGH